MVCDVTLDLSEPELTQGWEQESWRNDGGQDYSSHL